MQSIQTLGLEFLYYLQSFHPQLDALMAGFALLIKPEIFFVFVVPVMFWQFNIRLIANLYFVTTIDMIIGEILKIVFAQPRPWWISDLVPIDAGTSIYSSPGGYTSFAVVFYGYLALHIKKAWFTALAVCIVLMTGIAKMYQAAMLPDHMVMGVIQGALILYAFKRNELKLNQWFDNASFKQVIAVALALLGGFYLLNLLAYYIHSFYRIPVEYLQYKVLPSIRLGSGGMVYAGGFMAACLIGYKKASVCGLADFTDWSRLRRIIMSVVGIAGIMVIFILIRTNIVGLIDHRFMILVVNLMFSIATGYWLFYGVARLCAPKVSRPHHQR